jgi:hypothetical protein
MSAPTAQPGGSAARFTATPRGGCVRLQVAGEVDLLNQDQFHGALAALAALARDGITTVHLEMSQLQFADLACTREVVAFALSHPRLRVILHDPPESLQRIISLLGLPGPGANIHIRCQRPASDGDGHDGTRSRAHLT